MRSAQLDASTISVDIEGSKVILKGIVRSWAEKEEAARQVGAGRTHVDNRITISS